MMVDRIYLGSWLPRTNIHLREIYDFLRGFSGLDLNQKKLDDHYKQLDPKDVKYNNCPNMDSVEFMSGKVLVTVTEDGIIQLMIDNVEDARADLKEIETFQIEKLGPALAYLFSRGAPLPQTLVNVNEFYPMILVGSGIEINDAQKILKAHNLPLLAVNSFEDITIFFSKDFEIINVSKRDTDFATFMTNVIFIDSFSDLLRRYLITHRNIWTNIDLIRNATNIRYNYFPSIRNTILKSLKDISFIKTRINQMTEILSARKMIITPAVEKKLINLGFENFRVLESSSRYFNELYKMTEDYAQSTLALFESLLSENTQREVRLLQQITVLGAIVGFFGMNIAFPWEERWPNIFVSSFVVIGIIISTMSIFYFTTKKFILSRKFDLVGRADNK